MAVAIGLYALSLWPTIWLLARLRARALQPGVQTSIRRNVADIGALSFIPIAVSAAMLWVVPALLDMAGASFSNESFNVTHLGEFCVAQLIWSLPSACFYVLVLEIWKLRASLFRIFSYAIATLLMLLVAARIAASDAFMWAAGLVAQVFGGILPMSAAAAVPSVFFVDLRTGYTTVDWSDISPIRTGLICLVLCICAISTRRGRLKDQA